MKLRPKSASVSSTTSSQSGQEATNKQANVVQTVSRALAASLPNPSPMSYFAAGYAFRGIVHGEGNYKQNPVRYSGEPLELGDKQYYEIVTKRFRSQHNEISSYHTKA